MFINGVTKGTSFTNIHSNVKTNKAWHFFFFLYYGRRLYDTYVFELLHISTHVYEIDFELFG